MESPCRFVKGLLLAALFSVGLPRANAQEESPVAETAEPAAPSGEQGEAAPIASQRDASVSIAPIQTTTVRDAAKSEVAINWENVTLKDCIEVLSRDLGMEFIISPSVNVAQEVSIRAGDVTAWDRQHKLELFDAILDTAGVQRIQRGRVWVFAPSDIRPVVEAFGDSKLPDGQPVIGVLKLTHVTGAQVQGFLGSLGGKPQQVFALAGSQTLIVLGTQAYLRQVEELVKLIDQPPTVMAHFILEKADSEDVANELTNIFYRQIGSNGQPVRFFAVPRLNAVVAQNLAAGSLPEVERWVRLLDSSDSLNERVTKVYRMQVIEAETIGKTLGSLYSDLYKQAQLRERERGKTAGKGQGGGAEASSSAAAKAAAKANGSSKTTAKAPAPSAPAPAAAPAGGGGNGAESLSSGSMEEEVIILADKDTNTLIVNAPADMHKEIERTIKELDKSRRQVLIETAMVEVTLDEGTDLGVEWSVQGSGDPRHSGAQNSGLQLAEIASGAIPLAGAADGLTYFVTSNDKKWALIQAAKDDNRLQVLSSPTVLTRDGMEAEVSFGEEVPVRQSSVTDGGRENFSFDYRDAKITLKVTPHIDDHNMVTLALEQIIKRVEEDKFENVNNAPTFRTREIRSNLQVDNGQTVILGGLIERGDAKARVGIPYLMDIPVLGYFFGRTITRKEGTEILMILTPRVVDSRDETDLLTDEFRNKVLGAMNRSSTEIRTLYNLQEGTPEAGKAN